jgi:hypothetical protein
MLANFNKILRIALAAAAFTTASMVATNRAIACPGGYFQCGGVCCPR